MLSHNGKPVDPPPPYTYPYNSLPGWYHHKIMEKNQKKLLDNILLRKS